MSDDFQGIQIETSLPKSWEAETSFNDILYDWMSRAPWLTEEGRGSFYRQFAQADERYTAEVEPLFGNIRCPVSILWGEDDDFDACRTESLPSILRTSRSTVSA